MKTSLKSVRAREARPAELAQSTPRREPVQRRSVETVDRIQAAASRLLRQGVDLDQITTPQIAKEAGVSIGALYRFFADKQAIIDAITVRRVRELEEIVIARLADHPQFESGAKLIGCILDAYAEFVREHPEFGTIVHSGSHISESVRERYFGWESEITRFAQHYVVEVLKVPFTPDLEMRWRLVGVMTSPLLAYAFQQAAPALPGQCLEEIKRLISSYLFNLHEFAAA